jgi:hypothetical protein
VMKMISNRVYDSGLRRGVEEVVTTLEKLKP